MKKNLNKYYQEDRYKTNLVEDRENLYYPTRLEVLVDKTSVNFNNKVVLDHGCGDGGLGSLILDNYKNVSMYGTDISSSGVKIANEKFKQAIVCDLNSRIPYPSNKFDVILAIEIIEHLVDPDSFLEECYRMLKPGGKIIITTPNLLSWYQRILCIFGIVPTFSELSSRNRQVGLGFMKKVIINKQPVGHIRVFNKIGLYDIVDLYKFKNINIYGAPIYHQMPLIIKIAFNFFERLFSKFSSLSSDLILIAKK